MRLNLIFYNETENLRICGPEWIHKLRLPLEYRQKQLKDKNFNDSDTNRCLWSGWWTNMWTMLSHTTTIWRDILKCEMTFLRLLIECRTLSTLLLWEWGYVIIPHKYTRIDHIVRTQSWILIIWLWATETEKWVLKNFYDISRRCLALCCGSPHS